MIELGTYVREAAAISAMAASSVRIEVVRTLLGGQPSVSALEKLAITPWLRDNR